MKTKQEVCKELLRKLYDSTKHFETTIAKEAFKLIDEQCPDANSLMRKLESHEGGEYHFDKIVKNLMDSYIMEGEA